jgi:hypothetical protein
MARSKKSLKIAPALLLIALMVALVFSSGCVIQGILNIFGSDVVKISRSSSTTGTNNVIVVTNKRTLPDNTVFPDTKTQVFVTLENKDNDPSKIAKNVFIDMFDVGLFKGVKYDSVKQKDDPEPCYIHPDYCFPNVCSKVSKCPMPIGSTKEMEFMLRSPNINEIAGIRTPTSLRFKVSYDYSGSSSYEVLVVDYNEIVRRQRSGEQLSTALNDIRGSGPIAITVTERVPFVTTGTDTAINFRLVDRGNGEPKNSTIEKGKLVIEFPSGPKGLVSDLSHLVGDIQQNTAGGGISATGKVTEWGVAHAATVCSNPNANVGEYGCVQSSNDNKFWPSVCYSVANIGDGLWRNVVTTGYDTEDQCNSALSQLKPGSRICEFQRKDSSSPDDPNIIYFQCSDPAKGSADCSDSTTSADYRNFFWLTDQYKDTGFQDRYSTVDSCFADLQTGTVEGYNPCDVLSSDLHSVMCKKLSTTVSPSSNPTVKKTNTGASSQQPDTAMFSCVPQKDTKTDAEKIVCTNLKDIPLWKDQSDPLYFQIKNAPAIDVPYKSFYINAHVDYTYELYDSADVTVQPPV